MSGNLRFRLIRHGLAVAALGGLLTMSQTPAVAEQERGPSTAIADAWITTQIHAKFFADPDVKGRNIAVDTSNGAVVLSGEVYSELERRQALAAARETSGVGKVVDRLQLVPGQPPITADMRDAARAEWEKRRAQASAALDRAGEEIADGWVTTKVQSKYYLDPDVKGLNIDVTTENGVVTLAGVVTSPMERIRAIELATTTDGVRQVVDRLTVK
jgi:osmotically-inducible protein OsmY